MVGLTLFLLLFASTTVLVVGDVRQDGSEGQGDAGGIGSQEGQEDGAPDHDPTLLLHKKEEEDAPKRRQLLQQQNNSCSDRTQGEGRKDARRSSADAVLLMRTA